MILVKTLTGGEKLGIREWSNKVNAIPTCKFEFWIAIFCEDIADRHNSWTANPEVDYTVEIWAAKKKKTTFVLKFIL